MVPNLNDTPEQHKIAQRRANDPKVNLIHGMDIYEMTNQRASTYVFKGNPGQSPFRMLMANGRPPMPLLMPGGMNPQDGQAGPSQQPPQTGYPQQAAQGFATSAGSLWQVDPRLMTGMFVPSTLMTNELGEEQRAGQHPPDRASGEVQLQHHRLRRRRGDSHCQEFQADPGYLSLECPHRRR